MTYDDLYGELPFNMELLPAKGDNDPCLIRTRSFMLNNQTEWGYLGAMQEPFNHDVVIMQGVYDPPHWSDPVYFAA